jgi:sulfatase modifying factor 1
MRLDRAMQQQRLQKAARFCAFTVLVSSMAASCGRKAQDSPEPAPSEPIEIPHFIPPKTRSAPHDAGPDSGPGGRGSAAAEDGGGGGIAHLPDAPGCPAGMGRFNDTCIDRYEIILVDKENGGVHPYFEIPPRGMKGLAASSRPGVFPQGHLSRETAGQACENAGKRLCTLDEWQAACSGGGARRFPYGNEALASACNTGKREPHILDKHFPGIPHMQRSGKQFNDPALLQDPDYLEKTGRRGICMSPEGIFDMDGNLSEWVADTVLKPDGMHGTFAGDAFSGAGLQGCYRKTDAHVTGYLDYSMGTRCCADAKGTAPDDGPQEDGT